VVILGFLLEPKYDFLWKEIVVGITGAIFVVGCLWKVIMKNNAGGRSNEEDHSRLLQLCSVLAIICFNRGM